MAKNLLKVECGLEMISFPTRRRLARTRARLTALVGRFYASEEKLYSFWPKARRAHEQDGGVVQLAALDCLLGRLLGRRQCAYERVSIAMATADGETGAYAVEREASGVLDKCGRLVAVSVGDMVGGGQAVDRFVLMFEQRVNVQADRLRRTRSPEVKEA